MADSFLRFDIEREWFDVNTFLRIPIGDAFEFQVTGGSVVDAATSIAEPTSNVGELLKVLQPYGIRSSEDKLWMRASEANGTSSVAVRINGPFDPSGDYASADYSADYSQDI